MPLHQPPLALTTRDPQSFLAENEYTEGRRGHTQGQRKAVPLNSDAFMVIGGQNNPHKVVRITATGMEVVWQGGESVAQHLHELDTDRALDLWVGNVDGLLLGRIYQFDGTAVTESQTPGIWGTNLQQLGAGSNTNDRRNSPQFAWLSSPTQGWVVSWMTQGIDNKNRITLIPLDINGVELSAQPEIQLDGIHTWLPGDCFHLAPGRFFAQERIDYTTVLPNNTRNDNTYLRAYTYGGTLLSRSPKLGDVWYNSADDAALFESWHVPGPNPDEVITLSTQIYNEPLPGAEYAGYNKRSVIALRKSTFDGSNWTIGTPTVIHDAYSNEGSYAYSITRLSEDHLLVDMIRQTGTPGDYTTTHHFERVLRVYKPDFTVLTEEVIQREAEEYQAVQWVLVTNDQSSALIGTRYTDQNWNYANKLYVWGGPEAAGELTARLRPQPTGITLQSRTRTYNDTVLTGNWNIRFAVWEIDEYRIMSGWPVPVPDLDIQAKSLVSAEGEVLAYRDDIRGLQTNALVRWCADDDLYDTTTFKWLPVNTTLDVVFDTTVDYAPTLINDYEYRVRDEVFTVDALNFDADAAEHLWTNLGALGGNAGYTMIMVAALNSVYGNTKEIEYSGLWCPYGEQSAGWVSLTLQGEDLFVETDQTGRQKALGIADLLSGTAPVMLALSVGRPYITVYAGTGPSNIRSGSVVAGANEVAFGADVVIGRTNDDLLHNADMALMDLSIYADQLGANAVKDEFIKLASVYGGVQ